MVSGTSATTFSPELNITREQMMTMFYGYAEFMVCKSFTLELDFNIKPVFVAANPLVSADNGKIALTYGPLVYCVEGADNGERLGSPFLRWQPRAQRSKKTFTASTR